MCIQVKVIALQKKEKIMKYLFVIFIIIIILIIIFACIGYYRTKVGFEKYKKEALNGLPYINENVIEIIIKKINSKSKYIITTNGLNDIKMNYVVSNDDLLIKKYFDKIKPFIKFKYLQEDLEFPEDKEMVLKHGTYNMELHINEDELESISKK
jgi:uncharacterized protein YneF (UPF0154 family)